MAGIFPETGNGGVVYRTADGECLDTTAENTYCPGPDFIANCDMTALSSNCNARLTPAQINAIVSELVALAEAMDPGMTWDCEAVNNLATALENFDVGLVFSGEDFFGDGSDNSPYGINWGRICEIVNESPPLEPDNARILACGPNGGLRYLLPESLIQDTCMQIPDLGETCGVGEQLVAYEDPENPGCYRIGRLSLETVSPITVNFGTVWPDPDAGNIQLPSGFPGGVWYNHADFQTDSGVDFDPYMGGAFGDRFREAPGLDHDLITDTRLARLELSLNCNTWYDIRHIVSMRQMNTAEDAYGRGCNFGLRVRYSSPQVTPWLYYMATNGQIGTLTGYNNIIPIYDRSRAAVEFVAGELEVEIFYTGWSTLELSSIVNVNPSPTSSQTRFIFTPLLLGEQ